MQAFLDKEESMLKGMVEQISKTGANFLFCQKGIDDLAQHFLSKAGISAVRRVKKSDIEKLSKATGATIVTRLNDLSKKELLNTVPNPLTKESKMIALKKANRITLYRTIIIGLLIGFFATVFVVLVLRMPTL